MYSVDRRGAPWAKREDVLCHGRPDQNIRQKLRAAIRPTARLCGFYGISRVAVGNAEFTLANITGHVRRSMYGNARVAYEHSEENDEADVAGRKFHVS